MDETGMEVGRSDIVFCLGALLGAVNGCSDGFSDCPGLDDPGLEEGFSDIALWLGALLGAVDGCSDGCSDGFSNCPGLEDPELEEGFSDIVLRLGALEGCSEGSSDGRAEISATGVEGVDGCELGKKLGLSDDPIVGLELGVDDAFEVDTTVGALVCGGTGANVGTMTAGALVF
jgi:hypothetical protein